MAKQKLLIVGAGPVGLAAALFVSRNHEIQIEIVDKMEGPRSMIGSKALAINPRSMSLFTGFPIQSKLIENSLKVTSFKIFSDSKLILQNNIKQRLKKMNGVSQFHEMFIYPQYETEQLLENQLIALGIQIKRGTQVDSIMNLSDGVRVGFRGESETKVYDHVLAADGAHSVIRKKLGINFPGETLSQKIYVADYANEGPPHQFVQIILGNPSILLIFPVKHNKVRLVANFPDFEGAARKHIKVGRCDWSSQFKLSNRHVERMSVGHVYLAGDAAHVHAPIGGRGMNLGFEDVYVFSHLLKNGKLHEYHELRYPVISRFVERIKKASGMLEYKKSILRSLAPFLSVVAQFFISEQTIKFITGQDHSIPYLPRL